MINGNCKIPERMFIGSQSVVNNGLNMCEYNNMCGGRVIPSLSRVYKNKVK
jgi:carbonic anhydrase/acetyltransferase-like protein (isoleucine patch superfamily)